jgi:hypothetical protein
LAIGWKSDGTLDRVDDNNSNSQDFHEHIFHWLPSGIIFLRCLLNLLL